MAFERTIRSAADLQERLAGAFHALGAGPIHARPNAADSVYVGYYEYRWVMSVDVAIEAAGLVDAWLADEMLEADQFDDGGQAAARIRQAGDRIRAAAMATDLYPPEIPD